MIPKLCLTWELFPEGGFITWQVMKKVELVCNSSNDDYLCVVKSDGHANN